MINNRNKIVFYLLLLIALTPSDSEAQNNTVVSGGEATGVEGSASYSIGQVFYTTNSGTNGSLGQGVQQPFEISILTDLNDTKEINLTCLAYPNPTTDFLTLSVVNNNLSGIRYLLFDCNGKLLQNKKVEGAETIISMKDLAAATYFIKVTDNEKEVKIFTVIKN